MKKTVKGLRMLVVLLLSMVLFISGCGERRTNSVAETADLSKYPIKTKEELTFWCSLPGTISNTTDNLATTHYAQEYSKRTGIKVKYIHPAAGQGAEALSLMVASNELPDMISYIWKWYNGGISGAIEDKVILPVSDIIEYAPNLKSFLEAHPEYDKMVKTDDKKYPYFPLILDGDELTVTAGPAVRQDFLDKYNLNSPETIDDWTHMLRTFKENGIQYPLSFDYSIISCLYNMFSATNDFFIDENDQIRFGMADESFKEALIGIKSWYNEGLLDKNIISVDSKMIDSHILNHKTGATITAGGSGIGKYMEVAPNEEFNIVGVMFPVKERGTVSKYTRVTLKHASQGVAVTTKSKNPALSAKFLDYAYSEEGHMLSNFGTEGISYNMINGYPTYSDLIMDNPDGNPVSQMLTEYTQANNARAIIQDVRYLEQFYSKPQQKIAIQEWRKGAELARTTYAVPFLTLTSSESEENAQIYNEILNYANAMSVKFFTGVEPIEKFSEYLGRIKTLGLDRMLEIQNEAYKRYKNR